jgi:DNA replication licensing factor MCM7
MAGIVRNYSEDQEKIKGFLSEKKYMNEVISLCSKDKTSISIHLGDLQEYDAELCDAVLRNSKRYMDLFSNAVFDLMPVKMVEEESKKDCLDIYIEQRFFQHQKYSEGTGEATEFFSRLPKSLVRRFDIHFHVPKTIFKPISVRQLKATKIGHLVAIKGIVTRISEVKPLLMCATYTCDQCGSETFQPLNGSASFVPLEKCISEECKQKNASGRLYFQTRASRFVKFQELKVQEHSDQVPVGNIPRSLLIMVKGDLTRCVLPGDHVAITGVFLPTLKVGFKQLTGGLISETFLDAHRIVKMNKNDDGEKIAEEEDMLSQEEVEGLLHTGCDPYTKLANSIAPEIFGHEDLKRALLLLLIGGVDRSPYGMKIRGNVNICMFGDPGVAKSQLLGFINRISTRSQYTTGRGSSGVGLTASVTKDQVTGEMILEGGALVLADKGVCCIDEFDKMAETDKVAIHEVMEQQTISIAKAGILTTLNARVSILAAANPIFGRYNLKKSIQQNIELPAALLSRFDLIWLITDTPNSDFDRRLAQHITEVHMTERERPNEQEESAVDMKLMRRYIALCKTKEPMVPEFLTDFLVDAYIEMRKEARNNKQIGTFTSPRTLLAILRLSTALARLRLADVVEQGDVNEAIRLIEMSKDSLNKEADDNGVHAAFRNTEKIFRIIKESAGDEREVLLKDVREKCLNKGFTDSEFDEALEEYEELNIWQLSRDKSKVLFV